MIQGETLKTVLSGFPVPVGQVDKLFVIFKQDGYTVIEKDLDDCTVDEENDTISFQLTQSQSLSLQVGRLSRSVVFIVGDSRYETKPSIIQVNSTSKPELINTTSSTTTSE